MNLWCKSSVANLRIMVILWIFGIGPLSQDFLRRKSVKIFKKQIVFTPTDIYICKNHLTKNNGSFSSKIWSNSVFCRIQFYAKKKIWWWWVVKKIPSSPILILTQTSLSFIATEITEPSDYFCFFFFWKKCFWFMVYVFFLCTMSAKLFQYIS